MKLNLLLCIGVLTIAGLWFVLEYQPNTQELPVEDARSETTEPEIDESAIQFGDNGFPISYCDRSGTHYPTIADARAAGLSDGEFGTELCPQTLGQPTSPPPGS